MSDAQLLASAIERGGIAVALGAGACFGMWLAWRIFEALQISKRTPAKNGNGTKPYEPFIQIMNSIAANTKQLEAIAHVLDRMRQASEFEHQGIRETLSRIERSIDQ